MKAIWLTGLPSAGKTTIAHALQAAMCKKGIHNIILDGDVVRKGLCNDLGFSKEDRKENIRRIRELCVILNDQSIYAIVAAISPNRVDRVKARFVIGAERFLEVYVDCPLAVCIERDTKGMYKEAQAGTLKNFTGIGAVYEAPICPDLHLKTDQQSIQSCVQGIMAKVL